MHAIGADRDRHIDAVVDDEGRRKRRQGLSDRPRLLDQYARLGAFVAQLDQRGSSANAPRRQIGELTPAGALGIDDGVETKIEPHQVALIRARSVARSTPCNASIIAPAKLPGPRAAGAATSPATPNAASDATVASQGSVSTASAAQTSAAPAHPMAVTNAMSESPLAIARRRRPPSLTISTSPVSATIVAFACA